MARTTIRSEDISSGTITSADLDTNITVAGDLTVGTSTAGVPGLSVESTKNIGWTQSSGESIANMFRQASTAANVSAYGYQQTNTSNGFASSYSSSLAKSAIAQSGDIVFYSDAASTVAEGTDVTPTERFRMNTSGWLQSRGDTTGITRIGKSNSNPLSLADDGYIYLTGNGIGGVCVTCIYEIASGYGAVFAHGYSGSSASVTMLASTYGGTTVWATSNTDGKYSVYHGSGHYVVFQNRIGSTKNFNIATFGASFI